MILGPARIYKTTSPWETLSGNCSAESLPGSDVRKAGRNRCINGQLASRFIVLAHTAEGYMGITWAENIDLKFNPIIKFSSE